MSYVQWEEPEILEIHVSANIAERMKESADSLLQSIEVLRKKLQEEHEIALPPVRIRDYATLRDSTYEIHLRGSAVYLDTLDDLDLFPSRATEALAEIAIRYAEKLGPRSS